MISTKRRVIIASMKELKQDYTFSPVKDITDFIQLKFKCTRHLARLCAQDLKNKNEL